MFLDDALNTALRIAAGLFQISVCVGKLVHVQFLTRFCKVQLLIESVLLISLRCRFKFCESCNVGIQFGNALFRPCNPFLDGANLGSGRYGLRSSLVQRGSKFKINFMIGHPEGIARAVLLFRSCRERSKRHCGLHLVHVYGRFRLAQTRSSERDRPATPVARQEQSRDCACQEHADNNE